jgi:predicted rRNA methylase YqxC with S4 and FtsJ domains
MPNKSRSATSRGARVAPSVNVSRAIAKTANSIRSRGALKTYLEDALRKLDLAFSKFDFIDVGWGKAGRCSWPPH